MLLLELADSVEHRTQLQRNTYDGLGRLRNAVLGNGAVGIDYEYNLRGWTTNVTSNVFSQQIHYHDVSSESEPCFNGNISAIAWNQSATGNAVARHGEYRYAYDSLDRLTAANYTGPHNSGFTCQYDYDLHGNATRIRRNGITDKLLTAENEEICAYGLIDDVTLTYNGNRLVCADDAADALVYDGAMDFHDGANEEEEYDYDANGNLTKDLNKGISRITYDWNNLPREVRFRSRKACRYTYDASGRKLSAEYLFPRNPKLKDYSAEAKPNTRVLDKYRVITINYSGDNIYSYGKLLRTLLPTGYIEDDVVHYYVKDYQGNVRSVVREDGAVVESNEYYPYGGLFSATPSVQPYKYGAKELDRTHGLDWYDSQARFYDSILLRTNSMDKKAGDYTWLSPYLWCAANPIRFTDPTWENAVITIENDTITIQVNIFIQGANDLLLKEYYDNIMQNWGCFDEYTDITTGNKYEINWQVSVQAVGEISDVDFNNPANNFYKTIPGKSHIYETNNGKIRMDFSERPNPMAHEFGHNLGLRDRYENSKYYEAPGSQGDIMYEEAGKGKVSAQTMLPVVQPALFNHNIGKLFGKRKTVFHINKTYREPRIRKQKPIPNK